MRNTLVSWALTSALSLGVTLSAGATDVLGSLSTTNAATVSGQGLDVSVTPGREYPVFSGDRITAAAGEGNSVLTIPNAGSIKLSPNAQTAVTREEGVILLDLARGEMGFELASDAKVVLRWGDERIDLAQGTGKGGVSISADGKDAYLVLVDDAGGVRVTYLTTGAVVYEGGPDSLALLQAQFGQSGGTGGTVGGLEAGALGSTIITTAALPLALFGFVAVLAVTDSGAESAQREEEPTSPIGPIN
jgi:hypothetical protein